MSLVDFIPPQALAVAATSMQVSLLATFISLFLGIPIGMALGLGRFTGRRVLMVVANTGMALPPVVVGLAVMIMLSRRGPLGFLDLLYTPSAMVLAQVVIATPIIAAVSAAAMGAVPMGLRLQARALGAGRIQEALLVLREARLGVLAAVAAGFGGVISEVGAVMIVGGNIEGSTRVMTTAIVQESRRGNFGLALLLGAALLLIALVVNGLITAWQQGQAQQEGS